MIASWMRDKKGSEPACPACGKAWAEHAGTINQCAQLLKAKATIKRLKAKVADLREIVAELTGARP
jgi:hypothetical protein